MLFEHYSQLSSPKVGSKWICKNNEEIIKIIDAKKTSKKIAYEYLRTGHIGGSENKNSFYYDWSEPKVRDANTSKIPKPVLKRSAKNHSIKSGSYWIAKDNNMLVEILEQDDIRINFTVYGDSVIYNVINSEKIDSLPYCEFMDKFDSIDDEKTRIEL
jgi:hypothetical protein